MIRGRKLKEIWYVILKCGGIVLGIFTAASFIFFFAGGVKPSSDIRWGVTFSQKYAESLGLDARAAYLAILDDLGAKKIPLVAYWDVMEPRPGDFNFRDLDFELREAGARDANVLLVVGMKTPRWPECHIPPWAKALDKKAQQEEIKKLIAAVVARYKTSSAIWAWQVENEPFFPFGECPWRDDAFLKDEIALVQSIDPVRPVVVSESGEWSLWTRAAGIGDIVGTTLYRRVFFDPIQSYIIYPFPPVFYARKAWIIRTFFGKEPINVELQAEPWAHRALPELTDEEIEKTMSIAQFRSNVQFAKDTGLQEFYLWGAEWWYFMKEKRNNPAYWDEAQKVFAAP